MQGDWEGFIATGLAAKVADGTGTYYKQPIPPDLVAIYQRLLGHARAELIGRVALQTEATYALLQRFDVEYQRLKRRHRALRFEDIPRRLIGLAELATPGGWRSAWIHASTTCCWTSSRTPPDPVAGAAAVGRAT